MPRLRPPVHQLRADRRDPVHGDQEGWHARALRAAEARRRTVEGVRETPGQHRGHRGDRRQGRGHPAGSAREGDGHRRSRGDRDGGAEAARQGRLRAVRLGLSIVPGRRRVHERAEGPARREGIGRRSKGVRIQGLRVAVTLRQPPARSTAVPPPRRRSPAPRERKPFRDNTKALLAGVAILIAALAALLALASRSSELAPDVVTEVVLYALSITNLTMLVALVFVLARNVAKLVIERRRALPFARFRARLVAVLLGMTLIPAVLVLLVGSELIRNNIDQWFNAPMDNMLSSATDMASDYYQERQRLVSAQAARFARALRTSELGSADPAALREVVAPDVVEER